MGKGRKAAACACVFVLCTSQAAVADTPGICAGPAEYAAVQIVSMQLGLMDAALTCGQDAAENYNAIQIRYNHDLRSSDGALLTMFQRFLGQNDGVVAYDRFKTDMANMAELSRVRTGSGFCSQAQHVARTVLSQAGTLEEVARVQPLVDSRNGVVRCDTLARWSALNVQGPSQ